jgi:hypothetical protein
MYVVRAVSTALSLTWPQKTITQRTGLFVLTYDNKIIYRHIKTLMSDSEFDIHEEITSTYLEEVGYELGLSRGDTIQVCNKMIELGILKVTK